MTLADAPCNAWRGRVWTAVEPSFLPSPGTLEPGNAFLFLLDGLEVYFVDDVAGLRFRACLDRRCQGWAP